MEPRSSIAVLGFGTAMPIPVCIFAKPPVEGQVKTRLAQSIGARAAALLASAMLSDVWSTVCQTSGVTPVLAAATTGSFPIAFDPRNLWLQEGGDLGWRIECILRRGLQDAPAAVVLGADSPLLTVSHMTAALAALKTSDAVIAPSDDGGFYLLGLHNCPQGLLADLPWSTSRTEQKTVDRLREHNMTVHRLESLGDVDTFADLEPLDAELRCAPPRLAPATRRWFAENSELLKQLQWSAS